MVLSKKLYKAIYNYGWGSNDGYAQGAIDIAYEINSSPAKPDEFVDEIEQTIKEGQRDRAWYDQKFKKEVKK